MAEFQRQSIYTVSIFHDSTCLPLRPIDYLRWLISVQVFRIVGSSLSCRVAAGQSPCRLCDSRGSWRYPGRDICANSGVFAEKEWCIGMGRSSDLERSWFGRPCLRCVCRHIGWAHIHSEFLLFHNTCSPRANRSGSPPLSNSSLGMGNSTTFPNLLEATVTGRVFEHLETSH